MKTQTLIEILVQDAFQGRDFGRSVKTAFTIGNIVAGLAFFFAIGVRADMSYAVTTVRFLLKFAVTAPMALAATAAIIRVGRPGRFLGVSGWALAISPVVLGSALLVEMAIVPESQWVTRIIGSNARNCLTLIPLLAMAPLACFLIALRVGAPTRPGLAGAIAGLGSSGIAATYYAMNCTDDSPLFVACWYPIATSIVVATGWLAGSRLLKW